MKVYRVKCVVKRLDNVRAIFFEHVMTDSQENALEAVQHFRTTFPAPKEFEATIDDVFAAGDPLIPKADDCHPRFWGVI